MSPNNLESFCDVVTEFGPFGVVLGEHVKEWHVAAEGSSSPDLSSDVVSSRVWIRIPVITLVPLSK